MELRFKDPSFHEMEFTLKFLRSGKVVAKFGNAGTHYTLHPGFATGVLDLHQTDESYIEGNPARYKRLWALPHDVLMGKLLADGQTLLQDFLTLWRPLRMGWMIRRGLAIGGRIPTDVTFQEVRGIKMRDGQPEPDDPLHLSMKPPEFYEDVLSQSNSAYLVYDMRKRSSHPYGVFITYGEIPRVRMLWAKTRELNKWSRKWEPLFHEICRLGDAKKGS